MPGHTVQLRRGVGLRPVEGDDAQIHCGYRRVRLGLVQAIFVQLR